MFLDHVNTISQNSKTLREFLIAWQQLEHSHISHWHKNIGTELRAFDENTNNPAQWIDGRADQLREAAKTYQILERVIKELDQRQ